MICTAICNNLKIIETGWPAGYCSPQLYFLDASVYKEYWAAYDVHDTFIIFHPFDETPDR
jgi:hypothetical protein